MWGAGSMIAQIDSHIRLVQEDTVCVCVCVCVCVRERERERESFGVSTHALVPCSLVESVKKFVRTSEVKTTQETHSRGQRCGSIELVAYLEDVIYLSTSSWIP
jgi:hypothetical protein